MKTADPLNDYLDSLLHSSSQTWDEKLSQAVSPFVDACDQPCDSVEVGYRLILLDTSSRRSVSQLCTAMYFLRSLDGIAGGKLRALMLSFCYRCLGGLDG